MSRRRTEHNRVAIYTQEPENLNRLRTLLSKEDRSLSHWFREQVREALKARGAKVA